MVGKETKEMNEKKWERKMIDFYENMVIFSWKREFFCGVFILWLYDQSRMILWNIDGLGFILSLICEFI